MRVPAICSAASTTARMEALAEAGVYAASLDVVLRHQVATMLLFAATLWATWALYRAVPKGFFPRQDTGRIVGSLQADQASSFQAVRVKLADFITIIQADPAVESVTGFTGGGARNGGFMFISLKPLRERKMSVDQVIARQLAQNTQLSSLEMGLDPAEFAGGDEAAYSGYFRSTISWRSPTTPLPMTAMGLWP